MDISGASNRRRLIAGISLIAAPALLLAADVIRVIGGFDFESSVVAWVSFVLFVLAVLGVTHLLRNRADYLGLIGGAFCLVGAMAGAGIVTIFRLNAVLTAGGDGNLAPVFESAFNARPALQTSIFMPSVLFPLGFIVLAVGLYRARVSSVWLALLLAFGGLLYPIGRAVGVTAALLGGDVLWLVSLGWLGWQILTRVENWEQPAS